MSQTLKDCSRCHVSKEEWDFEARYAMCKDCQYSQRKLKTLWRSRLTKERRRAVDRMVRQASRRNHPDKNRAYNNVHTAVARGKLPPPGSLKCSDCQQPAAHYDHHRGYSKEHWFDVQPVCTRCHGKRTRRQHATEKGAG